MPIEIDWAMMIETAGIGGALILLIYFGFQGFKLMIEQWKNSTEAVNKNTEAFGRLSDVFELQAEREMKFQKEALELLRENNDINKDTNKKVKQIHQKIVD